MRFLRVLMAVMLLLAVTAGMVYAGQPASGREPKPVWVET